MNDPVRILVKRDELTLEGIKQASRHIFDNAARLVHADAPCVKHAEELTLSCFIACMLLPLWCGANFSWPWRRRNGSLTP